MPAPVAVESHLAEWRQTHLRLGLPALCDLQVLEQKLSNRYNSVRRCFLENKNGNTSDGYLDRREFRAALERIGIVLTGTEYRRLWRMFDSSGDGRLSYIEFNNKGE